MNSAEFSLIQTFVREFDSPRAPAGPGDDGAVLPPTAGDLCVTTDAVVQGVHFSLAHFRFEDIGHKALAVNLSDLAAMGAAPSWFLCSLGLPRRFGKREVSALGRGMSALARVHRIQLVGGNISAARELSVTLTAAGKVPRGQALTRAGGRSGDWLYVSGTLGEARLGLRLLGKGTRTGFAKRQLRPVVRLRVGQIARRFGRAAIDISDGLAQDLAQLCAASRTGARVDVGRLPLHPAVRRMKEAIRWALAGGEDYELLIAIPPEQGLHFERECTKSGERVTRIGELTSTDTVAFGRASKIIPSPPGFDHFE